MSKKSDFSEWYNEVIEKSNMIDKRYPVKGMNIWLPQGWNLMLNIDSYIRKEMEAFNYEEVYFPLLIPETEFNKEKEHIKGFNDEVYWATRAGNNELDIKLLLRPTSETAMYPIFSEWIRSHTNLPLKIFQIVNTFRYETKQTRAFVRVREIHFFEAHTCHESYESAENEIQTELEIMKKVANAISIPYVVCKRPDWDKFPGAVYSLGIDTFMGGRTLQIGSIHQYGQNFSKAYGISFEDKDGTWKYAYQTTYGMSERLVGAIVGVHGDDLGLIVPPSVSPCQVVIVPIYNKTTEQKIKEESKMLFELLKSHGIRVKVDDRDITPGNKFYYWEQLGVPIRLEIGEKEVTKGEYKIKIRVNNEARFIKKSDILQNPYKLFSEIFSEISFIMYKKAKEEFDKSFIDTQDFKEMKEKEGMFKVQWCGDENCAKAMEEQTGMKLLGTLYGHNEAKGKCLLCGKESKDILVYAKSF